MNLAVIQRLLDASKGNSLRAKLIQGVTGVGIFKLLSMPLTLLTSIVLARVLGPEGFGQYAFILSLAMVLSLPLDGGLHQLITREVAVAHQDRNWSLLKGLWLRGHHAVLLGALLLFAALGTIAALNADWNVQDRWTLLLVVLPLAPVLGLLGLRSATLRGLGNVVQAQLPEILGRPGFTLLVALGFLSFGMLNPVTALASQVGAAFIALVVAAVMLRRAWPAAAKGQKPVYETKRWTRSWLPFTALMATALLNGQIGILALGWLSTSEQVSGMQVAIKGAQLVLMALQVVNIVIAPYIARSHRRGDMAQLQTLFRYSSRVVVVGAAIVAVPLIFFGSTLISWTFGSGYIELAALPLAIVAIGQLANALMGPAGTFLIMSGYERDSLIGQGIGLGANILLAVVLIPALGAVGAAIAAATALIAKKVYEAVKLRTRLRIDLFVL